MKTRQEISVLDHISIRVSDYERSKRFFEAALAPLAYTLLFEHGISGAGFGCSGKPDFWIKQGQPSPSLHIAFASEDRAMVDAFYKAAMSCNGRDNGAPGLRPEYHSTYYGAFVLDPDGHNSGLPQTRVIECPRGARQIRAIKP